MTGEELYGNYRSELGARNVEAANKMKTSLVLGAGHQKYKRLDTLAHRIINAQTRYTGDDAFGLVCAIDIEPDTKPDFVHDLNIVPWPIDDSQFDEVHAYEILEHIGTQGDFKAFFAHFNEIWRVLRNGGRLYASVPCHDSVWTFGDPGHTRVINAGSLVFLCRDQYDKQLGKSAMSDYRRFLVGDWTIEYQRIIGESFCFVLRAVK